MRSIACRNPTSYHEYGMMHAYIFETVLRFTEHNGGVRHCGSIYRSDANKDCRASPLMPRALIMAEEKRSPSPPSRAVPGSPDYTHDPFVTPPESPSGQLAAQHSGHIYANTTTSELSDGRTAESKHRQSRSSSLDLPTDHISSTGDQRHSRITSVKRAFLILEIYHITTYQAARVKFMRLALQFIFETHSFGSYGRHTSQNDRDLNASFTGLAIQFALTYGQRIWRNETDDQILGRVSRLDTYFRAMAQVDLPFRRLRGSMSAAWSCDILLPLL